MIILTSSLLFSPVHPAPAMLASSHGLFKHFRHAPDPGPLHWLSFCLKQSSQDPFVDHSLASFKPLLKGHLLREASPERSLYLRLSPVSLILWHPQFPLLCCIVFFFLMCSSSFDIPYHFNCLSFVCRDLCSLLSLPCLKQDLAE